MNRKGFAVTAVIYGLSILGILIISILMGTLSASRHNVSDEANRIEQELIAYNRTNVIFTSAMDGEDSPDEYYYVIPDGETGWYRIEAFGLSLDGYTGSYATGIIFLEAGQTLYISFLPSESHNTVVRVDNSSGPVILQAAASANLKPGGTLKEYSTMPKGGDIDTTSFQVKTGPLTHTNLIGTFNETYSDGSVISVMAGYPGSIPKVEYNGYDFYFVDGLMLAAASEGEQGKVVITRLTRQDDETPTIPRINTKFDNVSAVNINNDSGVNITDIYITCDGDVVGEDHPNRTGMVSVTLSRRCNVDDASIIFDTTNNKYVRNVMIDFINDTSSVRVYNSSHVASGFVSTPTGIKLSAYQPDSAGIPPQYGNYYLIPVNNISKVVSARKNAESEENPIGIEYLQGAARQKWSITRVTSRNVLNDMSDIEYYISEQSRYKAMAIYQDQNTARGRILASMTFNNLSRNPPQIWKIHGIGDGTFYIKTVVPSYNRHERTGFLTVNTARKSDGTGADYFEQLMIGRAENYTAIDDDSILPTMIERFYLYNIDFGIKRN